MSGPYFHTRRPLPATGERGGYGGTTVTATGHVPVHTAPIRIPGRPAPISPEERWKIRSPWGDVPRDPEAERAAVAKVARSGKAKESGAAGRRRRSSQNLAEHTASVLAARAKRLAQIPPDRRSDSPRVLSAERAEIAARAEEMLLDGLPAAVIAEKVGVSDTTVQTWATKGWTTTPRPKPVRDPDVVPPDMTPRLVEAARLVRETGMGRREAARAQKVPLHRLRRHMGPADFSVPRTRTGESKRDQVKRLYGEGMTVAQIAAKIRMAQALVAEHLGIEAPPSQRDLTNAERTRQAEVRRAEGMRLVREDGVSIREAARRTGTSSRGLGEALKVARSSGGGSW